MGNKMDIDGAIDMEVSRKIGSRLNIILAHGSKSNMYYSLIQKLFDAFKDNYSVLRFNSTFINGGDERDVKLSLDELVKCIEYMGRKNIVLIGMSYGAYVSALLAGREGLGVKKVIALAYPLHKIDRPDELYPLDHMKGSLPVEFVMGDSDHHGGIDLFGKLLPGYKMHQIKDAWHSFQDTKTGDKEANENKVVSIVKQIVSEIK